MNVGERIKQRRKELNISADYLAGKIGVSRSTIFRYENGDIDKLPAEALSPIADALHCTVEYLMGWSESPAKVEKVDELTSLLGKMTQEQKDQLLTYARFLSQGK